MKRNGGIYRNCLRHVIGLLVCAAVFCICRFGSPLTAGESPSKNDSFEMPSSNLIIPTNKQQLTVRTGPGFFYPVKALLSDCERLEVVGKGPWYRVKYGDTTGYVHSSLFIDEESFVSGRLAGVYIGIDVETVGDSSPGISFPAVYNLQLAEKIQHIFEMEGATVVMPRAAYEENHDMEPSVRAAILDKHHCDFVFQIGYRLDSLQANPNAPYVEISENKSSQKYGELLAGLFAPLSYSQKSDVYQTDLNMFLEEIKGFAVTIRAEYRDDDLAIEAQQEEIAAAVREFMVNHIDEIKVDRKSITGDS